MKYFLSRKKQESVEESKKSCQRRGSALKDSEKRRCFRIFDNKLTEKVASLKKYGLWRLVKTIK